MKHRLLHYALVFLFAWTGTLAGAPPSVSHTVPNLLIKDENTGFWLVAGGPDLPTGGASRVPNGARFLKYNDGWYRFDSDAGWVREVDSNGRLLHNVAPSYDFASGLRSVGMWLDPGECAGGEQVGCSHGSTFDLPSGKFHELIRLTGTTGTDALASLGEFSGLRFEFKNTAPDLNTAVRGIIGAVTITDGGHARAGYFRTIADAGATGYMTSLLAAVTAASTQTTGNAIGLLVQSDGDPDKTYGIMFDNAAGEGFNSGIVFPDTFEANDSAIRLRQAATHGRIRWGATSPYIESPSADLLVFRAATSANTKVGIGLDAPQRQLHVLGASGAVETFPTLAAGDALVIENSGATGLAAVVGASSNFNIKIFGPGDAGEDGQLSYNRGTGNWAFKGAGSGGRFNITSAGSISNPGYHEFTEMTAPAAGAANTARLYAVDVAGKTNLCVQFATGAAQCFAAEP